MSVIDKYPLQKQKKKKNSSYFISVYNTYKIILLLLHLTGGYFTGIKITSGVEREIETKSIKSGDKQVRKNHRFLFSH